MRNSRHWLVASCAFAAMTVALTGMAQAQNKAAAAQTAEDKAAAANDAEKDSTVIEKVVVTAERRAASVQDTPLAITAFTDKARENLGIATIQDLQQFSPGLSYNAANDRPTIRGVGRQNNSHGLNSPVANYIDGVYTSSVQDTSRRPIFIDRVEVLRGPQGALSGKGSSAGAINTFLKRPKKYFEAEAGAYFNNYNRDGFEGTVTGPLNDSLRFRLNLARYYQGDGFFTNAEDGHTEGDRFGNRTLFDMMAAGDLGSKTEFYLKGSTVSYYETLHDGGSYAPVSSAQAANNVINGNACNVTPFTGGLQPSNSWGYFTAGTGCFQSKIGDPAGVIYGNGLRQNPVYLGGDLRSYINNQASDLHLEGYYNVTFDVTHHLKDFDARYIVADQRYAYEQSSDADGSAVQTEVLPFAIPVAGNPGRRVNANGVNIYREEPMWYSNEVTLTSTWDKKWQWIAGAYQFSQKTRQPTATLIYPGFAELNNPLDPITFAPTIPNARPFTAQYGDQQTNQDSWATFGQLDFKLNDKWQITGGLRYNSDKEQADERARLISNGTSGAGANGCQLLGGINCLTPVSIDASNTTVTGFSLAIPTASLALAPAGTKATVVDPGYRLADITGMRTVGPLSTTLCGGSATTPAQTFIVSGVQACAWQTSALLAPGVTNVATIDPVTGDRLRHDEGSWHALTGSVGINYTPNTDTLMYFRFARGYRPGGFGSTNAGFLPFNPYTGSETIDSYEAGTKFTLFSKLQMDISLFRYNYKNIQAALTRFERCTDPTDLSTCSAVGVTVNLPSAINQGVEVEGQWFVTPDLQMVLSYGYLDAHLNNGLLGAGFEDTTDPGAILPTAQRLQHITCTTLSSTCQPAIAGGTVSVASPGFAIDATSQLPRWTQDLSGKVLPQAPKNKIAFNANYTFHTAPGNFTASVSYIWRSEAFSDLFNDFMNVVPAYSQTNARVIFREKDDKWQAILFAQNIFNQDVFESGGTSRRQLTSFDTAGPLPPHTTVVPTTGGFSEIYYRSYGLVLPRVWGIEFLKKFR